MEDTGRNRGTPDGRARRIVPGEHVDAALRDELPHRPRIDRAHVAMPAERGAWPAGLFLAPAGRLVAEECAPLRGRATRGGRNGGSGAGRTGGIERKTGTDEADRGAGTAVIGSAGRT